MLLIDTYNLYHAAFVTYKRQIAYSSLIEQIVSENPWYDGTQAYAFLRNTDRSMAFARWLQSQYQITVISKTIREAKTDSFDVELALKASNLSEGKVIICSGSLNLLPLLQLLRERCIEPIVYSYAPPQVFKKFSTVRSLKKGTLVATSLTTE